MKRFRYTAVDRQGHVVEGTIEATDWSAATAVLAAQQLGEPRQTAVEEIATLSAADAVELAGYLSELAATGLPLHYTLREYALDSPSPGLRRAIEELTAQLEAGRPLDAALDALGVRLPQHIRRLLVAAARSGQLSQALQHLLEHETATTDMERRLRRVIAYPAVLLVILFFWLAFVAWDVTPQLLGVFSELDEDSRHAPVVLLEATRTLPWLLGGAIAAALVTAAIAWLVGGTAALSRLTAAVPLLGSCWSYRGQADFTGYLGEFLAQKLPLDESLRLAATGPRDPAIRAASLRAADKVSAGGDLARAFDTDSVFPKTLVRWAEWGQSNGALPDAMRAAGESFRERFELRLQIARVFIPAIIFGLVAGCALLVAGSVMQMMAQWIQFLTDWSTPSTSSPGVANLGNVLMITGTFSIAVLGLTALIIAGLLKTRGYVADAITVVLQFIGWLLLALAALFGGLLAAGGWGLFAWVLIVVAWIRGALRYRQMQKQSLWSALALAADRHVPLAPMARAFADEQGGGIAVAARDLARQLDAGADLAEATRWTWALPRKAPLAARIGIDTGDLTGALRAARGNRGAGTLLPPALIWLLLFVPAALAITGFMNNKVAPGYLQIVHDFDMSPPPLTQFVGNLFPGPVTAVLIALGFALLLVLIWLQWRGTLQPRLPVVKRIVRWLELNPVLRLLALVTRHGQPIPRAIATLGQLHPRRWIRRRMRAAARDVEQGYSWEESLRRRKLLGTNDVAVLAAAQRNGNLPWALDELGASYQRRAEFRLKAWNEFALPLLLLAVGMLVALFVVGYFLPIVSIIVQLT